MRGSRGQQHLPPSPYRHSQRWEPKGTKLNQSEKGCSKQNVLISKQNCLIPAQAPKAN